MGYVACLSASYAAKAGYSPNSQRVRILIRKMPSQKLLCSTLMQNICLQILGNVIQMKTWPSYHPGLAGIPAAVGSQNVMSQMRDFPAPRQIFTTFFLPECTNQQRGFVSVAARTSWDPTGAGISANPW